MQGRGFISGYNANAAYLPGEGDAGDVADSAPDLVA
jgi:hypothetical protein